MKNKDFLETMFKNIVKTWLLPMMLAFRIIFRLESTVNGSKYRNKAKNDQILMIYIVSDEFYDFF